MITAKLSDPEDIISIHIECPNPEKNLYYFHSYIIIDNNTRIELDL